MTELEKAIAIISAASGADATVVAERLKSDAAAQAVAIEIFEPKYKEQRDQGHRTATMKERKAVEKIFKDAGVEDASADALPAAIEALKLVAAEDAGKGITPEQALGHPAVKSKLNELTTATESKVREAVDRVQGDFKAEREAFAQKQLAAKVTEKAAAVVAELNPVFSQDTTRAATQRADLLSRIASGQFVEVNGELFPADPAAPGEVLTDGLGHAVKLSDFVRKQTETLYDLPVSAEKSSPGVKPGDVLPRTGFQFEHFKGDAPKTKDEIAALRADQTLPLAARKELAAYGETLAA